jgi:putative OPT family oligopeptide transporter
MSDVEPPIPTRTPQTPAPPTAAPPQMLTRLPETAYRELKPGEVYTPMVPATLRAPEVTIRSIIVGVVMCVVFSAAATYVALKVGQGIETAIPISIVAIGVSGFIGMLGLRRSTLIENVNILAIATTSGIVAGGTVFTMPAIYILNLDTNLKMSSMQLFLQIFLVPFLGAVLGVLYLVPFRRYFVKHMHGKLPFPEATAINEVFVTGEAGGEQAKTLVVAAAVGGIFDFLVTTVKAWSEVVNFQFLPFVKNLAQTTKATVSLNAVSLIVGLGYITGLRYSAIICAGGLFSTVILVPLIYHFGQFVPTAIPPAPLPNVPALISEMSANNVFRLYAQRVGVGAMAGAGIIGIIRSLPTIYSAFALGFKQILHPHAHGQAVARTDRDLRMNVVIGAILATIAGIAVFFLVLLRQDPATASKAPQIALTGLVIATLFSFLFATVAALATALTGNNPISGMTLVTLIVGSTALVAVGLQGDFGKYAAIVMGGVVCTALSMSGGAVTDLKVGYWLGSTPRWQQISKMLGMLAAAVGVAATVMLIHRAYGTTDPATGQFVSGFMDAARVPAPQANLFATILSGIFDNAPVTWLLYGVGLVLAVLLYMMQLPPLAFAIGMYLPLEINTPLLVGGLIAHFVASSSKDPAVSEERSRKGTLIASGFIAGGAIMGVVGALLALLNVAHYIEIDLPAKSDTLAQVVSILAFTGICLYLYLSAKRAKAETR